MQILKNKGPSSEGPLSYSKSMIGFPDVLSLPE